MQRCRLRLTALTLQNTRYHSINTRDEKKKRKKQPKTDTKDQNPKTILKKRFVDAEYLDMLYRIYSCRFYLHIHWTKSYLFWSFPQASGTHLTWWKWECVNSISQQHCIWNGAIITNVTWNTSETFFFLRGKFLKISFVHFSLSTCQIKCPFQL